MPNKQEQRIFCQNTTLYNDKQNLYESYFG